MSGCVRIMGGSRSREVVAALTQPMSRNSSHLLLMPDVEARCSACRMLAIFGVVFRDFPRQLFDDAPAFRRIRPGGDFREDLGHRRHDLAHVDDIRFTAGLTILAVILVDQITHQAVQARPLIFHFRNVRHDLSFNLDRDRSTQVSCHCDIIVARDHCARDRPWRGIERTPRLRYAQWLETRKALPWLGVVPSRGDNVKSQAGWPRGAGGLQAGTPFRPSRPVMPGGQAPPGAARESSTGCRAAAATPGLELASLRLRSLYSALRLTMVLTARAIS